MAEEDAPNEDAPDEEEVIEETIQDDDIDYEEYNTTEETTDEETDHIASPKATPDAAPKSRQPRTPQASTSTAQRLNTGSVQKIFRCNSCPKLFNSDEAMKIHESIHAAERKLHNDKFMCDACACVCVDRRAYKAHMLVRNSRSQDTKNPI